LICSVDFHHIFSRNLRRQTLFERDRLLIFGYFNECFVFGELLLLTFQFQISPWKSFHQSYYFLNVIQSNDMRRDFSHYYFERQLWRRIENIWFIVFSSSKSSDIKLTFFWAFWLRVMEIFVFRYSQISYQIFMLRFTYPILSMFVHVVFKWTEKTCL
jgi:hypothetical protein